MLMLVHAIGSMLLMDCLWMIDQAGIIYSVGTSHIQHTGEVRAEWHLLYTDKHHPQRGRLVNAMVKWMLELLGRACGYLCWTINLSVS